MLIVLALGLALWQWVDLEPKVDGSFFFAPGDPALRAENAISARFGSLSQIVVLASSPDLENPSHMDRIDRLSESVESVDGVLAVHSLARGPDSLGDARSSPLWRRLLLAGDGSTSFVIIDVEESRAPEVVKSLEELIRRHSAPDFALALAGIPYTVEIMRRQLVRDFSVFSGAAVLVFTALMLAIFRSGWIVVGSLATCGGAIAATLLLLHVVGFGVGLLTANLTTIVFVLTLSHVVFMTTNWEARKGDGLTPQERAADARQRTLRASIGSAVTTLLGFGSLIFVPAHPLQELGAGGALGAAVAFVAAYLSMPYFLERARDRSTGPKHRGAISVSRPVAAWLFAGGCLACGLGLLRLDADPSLLKYFDSESSVKEALETLDRAGGSSPLTLVIQDENGARLDSQASHDRLLELHRTLENDPAVGRIVSLPLLIAEAERVPGASLLKKEWVVDLIGSETTGAFLTRDRAQTLFLLQMSESRQTLDRTGTIDRIRRIIGEHGFRVSLTGGIYALQARLADLVERSVLWSLAALVLLFAGVASFASGSVRVGVSAALATALVPIATLGAFGLLDVPLDVIAAPAASVGLGLAADAALHLVSAWRREEGTLDARWRAALVEQRSGIVRATGIVALGFGLFGLSSFPPTQRFGLGVACAMALGAITALLLLPELARVFDTRRRDAESHET